MVSSGEDVAALRADLERAQREKEATHADLERVQREKQAKKREYEVKLLLLLFLTFSALVANPKKLLYTVANPARGLLNKEKKEKRKSLAAPPPPSPRAARSEKKKKKKIMRRIHISRRYASRRYAGGLGPFRIRTRIPTTRQLHQWVSLRKSLRFRVRLQLSQSRCLSLLLAISGRAFLFLPPRGHEPPPTLRDRLNPTLSPYCHRERLRRERSLGTSFDGQDGGNSADRRGTAASTMGPMWTRGVSTDDGLGEGSPYVPRDILPKYPVECTPYVYIAWERHFELF